MNELEKQFTEELIKKCEQSKGVNGYNPTRMMETIHKFGGVKTAKEILRKGRVSDGFDKLREAQKLELTMEATVIDRKYGELFEDEEVNSCYELLCEYGYYV